MHSSRKQNLVFWQSTPSSMLKSQFDSEESKIWRKRFHLIYSNGPDCLGKLPSWRESALCDTVGEAGANDRRSQIFTLVLTQR